LALGLLEQWLSDAKNWLVENTELTI